MATKNFSPENIISEDASDMVYKGRLMNGGLIAVKTFKIMAWRDPKQVLEEAEKVGKLGHQRVVNLIGYYCEHSERLLVAEFMQNDTLAKRLFHFKSSFEEWIQEVKDLQEVRKHGDKAFLEQDFKTAIECYSKFVLARRMVYPSVYARRSLSYLFCDDPDHALLDGMHAQEVFPDWPIAFYLQSVALAKLNMNTDSTDTLKKAAILEAKRSQQ